MYLIQNKIQIITNIIANKILTNQNQNRIPSNLNLKINKFQTQNY